MAWLWAFYYSRKATVKTSASKRGYDEWQADAEYRPSVINETVIDAEWSLFNDKDRGIAKAILLQTLLWTHPSAIAEAKRDKSRFPNVTQWSIDSVPWASEAKTNYPNASWVAPRWG